MILGIDVIMGMKGMIILVSFFLFILFNLEKVKKFIYRS